MISGRSPGPRTAPLVALLLLTLALTGVLAYHAQSAARSHAAAAQGALQDYAGFAAFLYRQYGRSAVLRTGNRLIFAFEPLEVAASGPLPSIESALANPGPEMCIACPRVDSLRRYFRVDLRDGSIASSAAAFEPEVRAWLADTVRALAAKRAGFGRGYEMVTLVAPVGGTDRAFAYLVKRAGGAAVAAYGVEMNPRVMARAAFDSVFARESVLPPALTRGMPPDSLLALSVMDATGREIYRSHDLPAVAASATDTLGAMFGGLRVRASLRASAADRLLIGGVPHSRLPMLLGLVVLAGSLTAVALLQLRRERELARVRADFVSGVSHELRTPLAQIRMFAETLRLGRVRSDAERQRSVEIIDQEARRLSTLVDNVLQFSRAERRAVRLSLETAALHPLVCDALETFGPLAEARRVTLRAELDEAVAARVDRGAFRQVLLNLLDNAVKYGPAGQEVEVALRRERGRAAVSVRDHGPGIPPRDRARVFGAFVRLEREAEHAIAGSGIGLAVVAQLVELHGGSVRVDDAPGGGALFVIDLPAVEPAPAGAEVGG